MSSAAGSLRRNRSFMLMWGGQTLSGLGSQISLVAYPLLVLAVTHSPAKAGVTGFAKTLPVFLLALPAGALADRMNRKHLMVGADAVRAIALIAMSILLVTGDLPYAVIVVVAFIDGAGFIVSYVSERGALRQIVPAELLGRPSRETNRGSSPPIWPGRRWAAFCSGSARRSRSSPTRFRIQHRRRARS